MEQSERSVWLVWTGEYEQSYVAAGFDSGEAARRYARMLEERGHEGVDVEEMALFSWCPKEGTIHRCYAFVDPWGPMDNSYCRAEVVDDLRRPFSALMEVRADFHRCEDVPRPPFAVVEITGTDEESVRRTYREKLAEINARLSKAMNP